MRCRKKFGFKGQLKMSMILSMALGSSIKELILIWPPDVKQ
jgi:hypothetical protein